MLRLRRLELRVVASNRTFGTDLTFDTGLNVLRADNTSGKSTCLQAIIYALGLEGMLSPKREVPLPHVMTDVIEHEGAGLPVDESWVVLEFENSSGSAMRAQRAVVGRSSDPGLIKTTMLDEESENPSRDYFVRRSGAAQREAGFHWMLARFLGWELPSVTRNDGSEGPLYLESLFPYFYVEQKHGWTGLQARIPTYLQIREVAKRSAEFVLGLDIYQRVLFRQRLQTAAQIMSDNWQETTSTLTGQLRANSVLIEGLPPRPVLSVDEAEVQAYVAQAAEWTPLEDALRNARVSLSDLAGRPIRTAGEDSAEMEADLAAAQSDLLASSSLLKSILQEIDEARSRVNSLELRLESLESELQRQQDAQTLQRLGATDLPYFAGEAFCPTCEQRLADGFEITSNPMSVGDNIGHLQREVRTFRSMRMDALRVAEAAEARAETLRADTAAHRRRIRSLEDALTSSSVTPSVDQISERLRLEERIETLEDSELQLASTIEDLRAQSQRWAENARLLAELGTDSLSTNDRVKLNALESAFIEQLQEYGFSSLTPSTLEISRDTYRPVHEGFDLGFDLSASDMVRVIWAYLISLLEIGGQRGGNHANLLILDEPRQQETSRPSFGMLLRRAAQDGAGGGSQVVIATSEEESQLGELLENIPHHAIFFPPGSKILKEQQV